jgi:nucleotide-binding universal stress UspA family protein
MFSAALGAEAEQLSHHYHGVERVLGTVASRVVNHSDRNVLVVHERR